jgi:uncharacterized protein (TIGR03067 family)
LIHFGLPAEFTMRLLSLFAALAWPTLLLAAPVPKDEKKAKDEDAIQGTWKADKFDNGGAPGGPPPGELEKIRFVFEKDGVFQLLGGPGVETLKGTFKIDPTAKLKTIDMTITPPGGGEKPETVLGLYELDGDTLKLCMTGGPGKVRPEEFKTDGKSIAVITFSRIKGEKKEEKKEEKKDK